MISIKNSQRKITIPEKKIKAWTQAILEIVGYDNFDVNIWLTTNHTIAKYNKKYRKKNKPTDILSFPFHTNIKPDKKIRPQSEDEKILGDIIISAEYAKKDANKSKQSLEKHLKILLTHGICHLIGYDHNTNPEYRKMHEKEKEILAKLD